SARWTFSRTTEPLATPLRFRRTAAQPLARSRAASRRPSMRYSARSMCPLAARSTPPPSHPPSRNRPCPRSARRSSRSAPPCWSERCPAGPSHRRTPLDDPHPAQRRGLREGVFEEQPHDRVIVRVGHAIALQFVWLQLDRHHGVGFPIGS